MLNWLENAVFYHVYPTSFCDGVGNLKGVFQGENIAFTGSSFVIVKE